VEPPPADRPGAGGDETVLLVDDEAPLRTVVRAVLDHLGYKVIEAASGKLALELIEQTDLQFDVLLTDMVMPGGVDGKELATRLRARQADLGVILMSGYSVNLAGQSFEGQERSIFLQKPFSSDQLANTVRRCLDSKPAQRLSEAAR
jgi:DNA-binding NtrC family response regulator